MRGIWAVFGKRYEIYRSGGSLKALPPTTAFDPSLQHERDFKLVAASVMKMEEEHAVDKALGQPSRLSLQERVNQLERSLSGGSGGGGDGLRKSTKREREEDKGDRSDNKKQAAARPIAGEFSNQDHFSMYKNKSNEYHVVRHAPDGTAISANPVKYDEARKALPRGYCLGHALLGGLKGKDGKPIGCKSTAADHAKFGEGAHRKPPKAWKKTDFINKAQRIVAIATLATILSGNKVAGFDGDAANGGSSSTTTQVSLMGGPNSGSGSGMAAAQLDAREAIPFGVAPATPPRQSTSRLASPPPSPPVSSSPFSAEPSSPSPANSGARSLINKAAPRAAEAASGLGGRSGLPRLKARKPADGEAVRARFAKQVASAIADAKKNDPEASVNRTRVLQAAARVAGIAASNPHNITLLTCVGWDVQPSPLAQLDPQSARPG